MFTQPGIGLEDLAWIRRDQFIYYVELERGLHDPRDWPGFRERLVEALMAAFALNLGPGVRGADGMRESEGSRGRVRRLLEEVRAGHDPVLDWLGFREALWEARTRLRGDL